MSRFISSIIKENDFHRLEDYYKANFLIKFVLIISALGILNGIAYTYVYDFKAGGIFLYVISLLFLGNIYLLKHLKSLLISGNITGMVVFSVFGLIVYTTGGVDAHSSVWFTVLVLFAFMIIGSFSGFVWSGITVLFFLILFMLENAGHAFPQVIAEEAATTRNLVTFICAVIAVSLLAYYFEQIRKRAFFMLDDTLNITVKELEETRDKILESAKYTANQAEQASYATHEVSEHLNNINDDIQEVKSSISQIEASTHEVEQSSEHASDITNDTESRIRNLQKSSEDIGKITDMITSINSQVNLLALNASVESARAGEAGAGFAVVADEIKALAQKTYGNTKNIDQTIDGVQGEINTVVERMSELKNIIGDLTAKQEEISGAVSSQAQATSQMADRVNESAQRGEEINHLIRELAASAKSLINTENAESEAV